MTAFEYDDAGRITYDGVAYPYTSFGTTATGLQRAAQFVTWLNKCVAMRDKQIATVEDVTR